MWVSSTPCSPAKCACVGTPRSLPEDRLPSMPIRPASWQHMTLLANNVRGMRCLNSFSEPCLASDEKVKLLASASLRICLFGSWMVPSTNRGSTKLTEQTSQRQREDTVHVWHSTIALHHHVSQRFPPAKGGSELRGKCSLCLAVRCSSQSKTRVYESDISFSMKRVMKREVAVRTWHGEIFCPNHLDKLDLFLLFLQEAAA